MGKALIVASLGAGEYTAKKQPDVVGWQRLVDKLSAALIPVNAQLALLANQIDAANTKEIIADAAMQAAIVAQPKDLKTLEAAWLKALSTLKGLKSTRDRLTLQRVALEMKLADLQSSKPTEPADETLWCADYSEELTGMVGTMEPAGDSDKGMIIVPGSRTDHPPAWNAQGDGTLKDTRHMSAAETFWNAAMLPGWQKWTPTYRLGTITALNGDRCDVALEAVRSDAQGIDVTQTTTLQDVGIDYMDCHGAAFEIGDTVVVMFTGQDWGNPQVIGFEREPRACGMLGFSLTYRTSSGEEKIVSIVPDATGAFHVIDRLPPFDGSAGWIAPGVKITCSGDTISYNGRPLITMPNTEIRYAWLFNNRTKIGVLYFGAEGRVAVQASFSAGKVVGDFSPLHGIPYYPNDPILPPTLLWKVDKLIGGRVYATPDGAFISVDFMMVMIGDPQLIFGQEERIQTDTGATTSIRKTPACIGQGLVTLTETKKRILGDQDLEQTWYLQGDWTGTWDSFPAYIGGESGSGLDPASWFNNGTPQYTQVLEVAGVTYTGEYSRVAVATFSPGGESPDLTLTATSWVTTTTYRRFSRPVIIGVGFYLLAEVVCIITVDRMLTEAGVVDHTREQHHTYTVRNIAGDILATYTHDDVPNIWGVWPALYAEGDPFGVEPVESYTEWYEVYFDAFSTAQPTVDFCLDTGRLKSGIDDVRTRLVVSLVDALGKVYIYGAYGVYVETWVDEQGDPHMDTVYKEFFSSDLLAILPADFFELVKISYLK